MIKLFHGSYMPIQTPLVKLGRKKVDFGQGFYLTKLREQAMSWAITIADRKGRNTKPTLSTYSFDYDSARSDGYIVKTFDSYNLEWLKYVIQYERLCPLAQTKPNNYDASGKTAN